MGLIKILWWGYLDHEGDIHVKRYVNDKQIQNYSDMPFTKGIFDPFYAFTADEAKLMCYSAMKQNPNVKWKGKPEC